MKNYSDVLKGFLFSLHSRRFVASVLTSAGVYFGYRYDMPPELIAGMVAPIIAFILGESYRDGMAAKPSESVNVGSAGTVNAERGESTPAMQPHPTGQALTAHPQSAGGELIASGSVYLDSRSRERLPEIEYSEFTPFDNEPGALQDDPPPPEVQR